jgi:hypothetical protein
VDAQGTNGYGGGEQRGWTSTKPTKRITDRT